MPAALATTDSMDSFRFLRGMIAVECGSHLFDQRAELGERRFLRKSSGRGANTRRDPFGEGNLLGHVVPRARVDLPQLRKAIRRKAARRSDKGRPQPPMDERDLALDKPTHQDIVAVADRTGQRKDLLAFRMRPPAAPNRTSSDGLSKRRGGPVRGFKDDTVVTNERERLASSHCHAVVGRPDEVTLSRARIPSRWGNRHGAHAADVRRVGLPSTERMKPVAVSGCGIIRDIRRCG